MCSLLGVSPLSVNVEHVFVNLAPPADGRKRPSPSQRPKLYWPPPAPVAELVDAQG
jgi:hypothetical protein